MGLTALISIHDVMPATMSRVRSILKRLNHIDPDKVLLLIVPGLDWSSEDLIQIQQWQKQGHVLAAHGWNHRCKKPVSVYHRIHSLMISRDVAEHLSYDGTILQGRIRKSYDWFAQNGLAPPVWYVPPAWAMGKMHKETLADLPFKYYESQLSVYHATEKKSYFIPLLGYEADTHIRSILLRLFNALNKTIALLTNKAIRLSIHPEDFRLKLASSLIRDLKQVHPISSVQFNEHHNTSFDEGDNRC